MLKLMGKKLFTILGSQILSILTMDSFRRYTYKESGEEGD